MVSIKSASLHVKKGKHNSISVQDHYQTLDDQIHGASTAKRSIASAISYTTPDKNNSKKDFKISASSTKAIDPCKSLPILPTLPQ